MGFFKRLFGGGRKKPKRRVTDYFMTVHYGVCQGPIDAVRRIRVREKNMWVGRRTTAGTLVINLPRLHGGNKKEGGAVGIIDLQLGTATQALSINSAARYGEDVTPATAPGYRGLVTAQFRGPVVYGSSAGPYQGFYWSSNQPVVPPVDIAVTRIPRGPGGTTSTVTAASPEPALEGYDGNENANPAYIIYECLTNTVWGMGAPAAAVDSASFTAAAATLATERFGLSLMWTDQSTIESFVQIILDHIEAVLYVSPFDGKFYLRLLRDDLVAANLPLLTEDDMRVATVVRQSPAEIVNEVVVTWTNPISEEDQTVTIQDLGGIVRSGGQIVSTSRNFFGIRDETLAWTVARRELASESTPLLSAEIEVDRRAWNYVPGGGVRLSSLRYGLDGNVFRVLKVNYGKPGQSKIQLNLIEDVFSRTYPVYSEAADGPTQRPMSVDPNTGQDPFDPRTDPKDFDAVMFETLPWFASSDDFQVGSDPNRVEVAVYPDTTVADAAEYELFGEGVTGSGSFESLGDRNVVRKGTTASALVREAVTMKPAGFFADLTAQGAGPATQQIVILGSATTPEADRELVLVQAVPDSSDPTTMFELWRGVLDTVPRAWPTGTEARILSGEAEYDDPEIRDVGVETDYKLLMITSAGQRDIDDAPVRSFTPSRRPHLPTRPANVSLEGTTYLSTAAVDGTGHRGLEFTWNNRNRVTEETRLLRWSDAAISPETDQETVARVYANAALTGTPRVVRQTRGGRLALGKADFPAASSWVELGAVFAPGEEIDEDSFSLTGAVIPVTNATAMEDALSPTSVAISGTTVTIAYAAALDPLSVPDPGDFAVTVVSQTTTTTTDDMGRTTTTVTRHTTVTPVTLVSVSGTTVSLAVSAFPGAELGVTVTYTKGENPVQEINGVDVAGASGSVEPPPPVTPTNFPVNYDDTIPVGGSSDARVWRLAGQSNLAVAVSRIGGSGGASYVFRPEGEDALWSGSTNNVSGAAFVLAAGTYELVISGTVGNDYRVRAQVPEDLGTLVDGTAVARTGTLDKTEDMYVFTLDAADTVRHRIERTSGNAPMFSRIYSLDADRTAQDGWLSGNPNAQQDTSLSAGTYYVRVSRVAEGSSDYRLVLTRNPV